MQVDMLTRRFFEELKFLYPEDAPFRMRGVYSQAACGPSLPPYRWVFSGCCMRSYGSGYRLPHLDEFIDEFMLTLRAKIAHPKHGWKLTRDKALLLDEDDQPTPGLLHRLSSRYRDGIAHTQVYCVLAQAYEDQRKIGTVLMDPRVDTKMKTDITVVGHGRAVRVDIGQGSRKLLASRAGIEADRKRNTSGSTEVGNPFLANPSVRVSSTPQDMKEFRGLRVFGGEAMNALMREIDDIMGIAPEDALDYREMTRTTARDLHGIRKGNQA